MSKIRGKDTKPELLVRKYLHSKGLRFRLHDSKLPGKPDIVLSKYNTVVLVQGCFWHGHKGCKYFTIPKTKTEWWLAKINRTVERDKENKKKLELFGWKVLTVWGCELKNGKKENTLKILFDKLKRLN